MRLDQLLVEKDHVKTRGQARALIEKGDVKVNDIVRTKVSFKVQDNDKLEVLSKMYVSRGAFKLIHALDEFSIDVNNLIAADIGASTGGFTQILLERGCSKIFCIDVGHDQLASELVENPKVINLEKTNAREALPINEKVDIFVCDVSFISLKLIFKNISDILKPNGVGIALIKPQFEAGRERIQKNGLVSDKVREEVLAEMLDWFNENNFKILNIIESPIKGNKSKNTEYLALYSKEQKSS